MSAFEDWLARGRQGLAAGDKAIAAECFLAARLVAPMDPGARLGLGMAMIEAGAFEPAGALFAEVLDRLPPNPGIWHALGAAMEAAGDATGAVSAFDRVLALDPRHREAAFARANLILARDGRAAAITAYERVLAIDPNHADALANLAVLLDESDRFAEAATAYRRAAEAHPKDPVIQTNFANYLYRAKDLDAASRHFQAALAVDPDHADAHRGLALLHDARHETALADVHRRRAFEGRAVITRPYFGAEPPIGVLILQSARGGNVSTQYVLDDRRFQEIHLMAEFWTLEILASLPPHQVVFNAIGDADRNASTLKAAAALAERLEAPVLNPPRAVLATGRADTPLRLAGLADVIVPPTLLVARDDLLAGDPVAALAGRGFELPVLLRPPGYHTGEHFELLETPDALRAAVEAAPFAEFFVTRYVDYRGVDGNFRKYRVLFINGELYPLHLAIGRQWKLHYFSADMRGNDRHKDEERRFLEDFRAAIGPRATAALESIGRRLGLDYGGIDFSLTAEGAVLVFEANANMLIHTLDPVEEFAYRHAHVPRVVAAFRAMIEGAGRG